jgi:WD40 repeat protein
MRIVRCLFVLILVLLISGSASAQEAKGWLGANLVDVTKADADKLGWDAPHGAKLGLVAAGSPADKAGLKTGDTVLSVDRTEIDTASELTAAIEGKPPGTEIHFRVMSGGHERRVIVTLSERPTSQVAHDQELPHLTLDTGGHMGKIRDLTFTPDGEQLVSAGDDKVIRVWDWRAGKTVRTIRGQVGPGSDGIIFAVALSQNGRWLAVGGWMDPSTATVPCCGDIRLYDFSTGKLVALLKGHTNVVNSLAFSPDSKQLISAGGDNSAVIWDVEGRTLLHRLRGHASAIGAAAFTPDGERVVTGSNDTTLRLWRVSDGGLIAEMKGHKQRIYGLAVRSSDSMIASGDAAGEIRFWGGKNGNFLRTLGSPPGWIAALRFSPDGQKLLSTSAGARLYLRLSGTLLPVIGFNNRNTMTM